MTEIEELRLKKKAEKENGDDRRNFISLILRKSWWRCYSKEMPSWEGNLSRLTYQYENWLQGTLADEISQISKTEHKHFFGTLKKAYASLSRSLEVFKTLLNQNIERVLGLRLAEAEWKIEVTEPSQPDIRMGRTFDFHLNLFWFLIPMFIFRRLFERHYLNQVPNIFPLFCIYHHSYRSFIYRKEMVRETSHSRNHVSQRREYIPFWHRLYVKDPPWLILCRNHRFQSP